MLFRSAPPSVLASPVPTPAPKNAFPLPFVFPNAIKTDIKRVYQVEMPRNSGQLTLKVRLAGDESYLGQAYLSGDNGAQIPLQVVSIANSRELQLQMDTRKISAGWYTLKIRLNDKTLFGKNKVKEFQSRISLNKQ